jgi:hypothetical protein
MKDEEVNEIAFRVLVSFLLSPSFFILLYKKDKMLL